MEKINLKVSMVFLCFLLCGCSTAVITPQGYETVSRGCRAEFLQESFGAPYETVVLENGVQEHTYLTRIPISPGCVDQVTYKFYVKDGKVFNKVKQSESSAASATYR